VTDEFGVRQVELYYTTESGQVYCLLEAHRTLKPFANTTPR
jgi:hypothetical protein